MLLCLSGYFYKIPAMGAIRSTVQVGGGDTVDNSLALSSVDIHNNYQVC